MSYRHRSFYVSAIAATLIVSAPLHAQTITGSIRGTVRDASGALVPDSQVTAHNVATGRDTSTKTDGSGTYVLQSLPIGVYTLTTVHEGFSSSVTAPFALEIDQIAKVDVSLKTGGADTTITVDATSGTLLQTENSTLGTTITSNTLESLPLSGQNFSAATAFVPGAVIPSFSSMGGPNGTERSTTPASLPSFNGNRQQTNNYILDGADINEPLNNVIGYNPAPEALQQIRIITGNADAEYGNVNGGEILMVTKGGTNQFHGSLYSYYENQDGTANLWSNNYNHIAKGVFHQNQFGATIGGPIIKNKLFFFADYEGYRNSAAGSAIATVATQRMRTGDFSELLGLNGGAGLTAANRIQLFNTANGTAKATPYAGNIIPVNNPLAQFLFTHPEIYPLPNHVLSSPTSSVDSGNYMGSSKTIIVNNQGDARVDYVLGMHDSINARFTWGEAYDATPKTVLPITFPGSNDYPTMGGVLNEVHTFNSSLQNAFRAGYTRIAWLQGAPIDSTGVFGTNGNALTGIGYTPQPFAGFSQVNLSSSESNVGTRATATTYYDNVFNYGDDVTWLRGRHVLKFGAQILRYQENNFYPSADGALGTFAYNGAFTTGTAALAPGFKTTGYGFADFALDKAASNGVGGVSGRVGARQYRIAGYVQDDWKLTPQLTVNIGLRYGWDQPMYEVNNKQVNVDTDNPASCPNCLEIAGQNGNSRALYNPFYKQYMPRLGFAYQANPMFVIRGGYGITDDMEGTGANLRMTQNPPFVFQYLNTAQVPTATSGGTPLSVRNGFGTNAVGSSTLYNAWSPRIRPSLIQNFNLTSQILLNSKTSVQMGYVGQVGQHLIIPENANQWTTPGDSSTAPFKGLVGTGGTVYLTQSEGISNYHALQVQVRQRETFGLEYTINYTWAKSMTNNPGFYGVTGVTGASVFPQNIYDPHADYGVSGFDTRNSVNGTMVFALPFGHGRHFGSSWNRAVDEVIGGWKISGDAILYSGFPITISATNVSNANAKTARANQYRPLIVKNRSLLHWFGTDASAVPCGATDNGTCAYGAEQTNSFGTARVGTQRAPVYRLIDMSVFKEFRTYKEQVILVRVDAFNTFNMASYSAPASSSVASTTFGQIVSTLSPARQLQWSAKYRF
jgi:hypothetical protein